MSALTLLVVHNEPRGTSPDISLITGQPIQYPLPAPVGHGSRP
jgi:hypothetical protein